MQATIPTTDLLDQLVEFYYTHDKFQTRYLPYESVWKLYNALYVQNRLCFVIEDEKLIGYGEDLRLGFEEFGRIICGENVYNHLWDWEICDGPIAYVANVTIAPEHRSTKVLKELTRQFFIKNKDAKYFVGRAFRKRHQPIKVFNFHESYLKWSKEA